jgi:hypothetical protein
MRKCVGLCIYLESFYYLMIGIAAKTFLLPARYLFLTKVTIKKKIAQNGLKKRASQNNCYITCYCCPR